MEKEVELPLVASSAPRKRVYDAIEADPGITISELARSLEIYWSAVAIHVERLTRAGLVRSARVGRRRVLFCTVGPDAQIAVGRGLLAEDACLRVARAIVEHPHQRIFELSHLTGISERALYHHVKRLVDAGLLSTSKERYYRSLEPTPKLRALLARLGH